MKKRIFYPIPSLCECGCKEITWNSHKFIWGHFIRINNPSKNSEICKKISNSKKGGIPWNKGKTNLIDNRILSGKNHPQFGKHHTIESINKMSESHRNSIKSIEQMKLISGENSPAKQQKIKDILRKKNIGKIHLEKTKQKISKSMSGEKHWNWRGGITKFPYCEKWTEEKREEIRNQYGRKCVICDRDEKDNITKTGKIHKLSVHHIDSDKEQGCNGKSWNLKPLCMHCHNKKEK